ncbi:MAG: CPBP family intramembrane metalloprotease [Candidatus Altarchaeum sp.]|nr:CPBP family intramembrane metalloprotease [Candidatus Altarchaeum sp.]
MCFLTLFLSGIFVLSASLFILVLLIIAGLLILLLLHEKFRENLIKICHLNIESENPRHYFALLLFLCILFAAVISFLWMTETGETIFETEINARFNILDLVINEIFYLAIAVFGYGYLTRKNLTATLNDLGVKKPTSSDILFGFTVGIGLIFLIVVFALIFQHFGFAGENTDEWLKNLISVQNAFVLGLSAGICEEILFRGALQPKFGIIPTALLFAFLHIQYPALWMLFMIFIIGIILGYVRKITNTTTAIIVHSTYDVVQMLMLCFFTLR